MNAFSDPAAHLRLIAAELRELGDVQLVRLTDDGVTPEPCSLADVLYLISLQVDALLEVDEPS